MVYHCVSARFKRQNRRFSGSGKSIRRSAVWLHAARRNTRLMQYRGKVEREVPTRSSSIHLIYGYFPVPVAWRLLARLYVMMPWEWPFGIFLADVRWCVLGSIRQSKKKTLHVQAFEPSKGFLAPIYVHSKRTSYHIKTPTVIIKKCFNWKLGPLTTENRWLSWSSDHQNMINYSATSPIAQIESWKQHYDEHLNVNKDTVHNIKYKL